MWFHEQQMGKFFLKKTEAELIWEALLQNAKQSLLSENIGVINRTNLDGLERQRELNDLELSDEEKAILDQMIDYMTRNLPQQGSYEKANKISAIWDYIKRQMRRK